jgi:hypothetical protein
MPDGKGRGALVGRDTWWGLNVTATSRPIRDTAGWGLNVTATSWPIRDTAGWGLNVTATSSRQELPGGD